MNVSQLVKNLKQQLALLEAMNQDTPVSYVSTDASYVMTVSYVSLEVTLEQESGEPDHVRVHVEMDVIND